MLQTMMARELEQSPSVPLTDSSYVNVKASETLTASSSPLKIM
jgi:hypothetical protein